MKISNELIFNGGTQKIYSSEINHEEPIASSHVMELSLSFIDKVK